MSESYTNNHKLESYTFNHILVLIYVIICLNSIINIINKYEDRGFVFVHAPLPEFGEMLMRSIRNKIQSCEDKLICACGCLHVCLCLSVCICVSVECMGY